MTIMCATVIMLAPLSGCAIFAAGVDSVKRVGLTEADREKLLRDQSKEFHSTLFFGRIDAATDFIDEAEKAEIVPLLSKSFKSEKLVEHSIDSIQFTDSSRSAIIELTVKAFRNTDFLVKEKRLIEHCTFHTGGKWKLIAYDVLPQT